MNILIKKNKKNQEYYFQKLSSAKCLEFKFIGLCDKDNNITHISINPLCGFFKFQNISDELKHKSQFTHNQFNKKFKFDDKLYCHNFSSVFDVREPISLERPVRGIRYAETTESKLIEDKIVLKLCDYKPILLKERLYHSKRFQEVYSKCFELDVVGSLFDVGYE